MGGNKSTVFMGMGFELVILILGAAYIGKYIDDYMHWPGYGAASMIILFLISWFYHLIILLRKFNEDDDASGS
jgi:hypothetical protein